MACTLTHTTAAKDSFIAITTSPTTSYVLLVCCLTLRQATVTGLTTLVVQWVGITKIQSKYFIMNVDVEGILDCQVTIIGGGISGLYMAYMLLKTKKESNVCIFENDPNLGGRIRDYHFKQAPAVDIGLGAWRIDKKHNVMINLVKELGITQREWSFVEPSLIESRGVKANNHEDIKKAYPTLRAHPFFGKMTSSQLLSYACKPEHVANAGYYATVDSYFSNLITPEGAEYLSELYGYKGDYTDFISPKSYLEFTEMTLKLSDKYLRPAGGMSTIIATLKQKVESMGGHIFTSTGVKSLTKENGMFIALTPSLRVRSKKLVVATPPVQFRKINGTIAKKIQKTAEFDSIQPIPAFKGAAVYSSAWWEKVSIGGAPVKPGQKFISHSNCLGISMAHRGKGTNGEGVLHTMYADGACSRRWADIANLKKNFLNAEVHRALETKFGTKIPTPLDTAYQYWDSA
ncbi:hypothetical protein QZH41_008973, partial [Actinostola sp. cb2023]